MKKITLFITMLFASIQLFANAEIVIYNNSTGTTIGSDFTISSNNFKNIVEAGDNIVVTVKDYTRVGDNYPYFQIEWGKWNGWDDLGTDLSNGENVVPLTAEDVTKINAASTYGINFRTNGTTSYTITKVVLRKNDSYADLETVTLNESSYSEGTQFQKVYGNSAAALRMSDGDLLVVVGKSDANSGGSWSMRELSTWDNTYSTGSFDGRDYAYIVTSDKGSRIHEDGFQFVTNKEMSAVKIAKKIYSLSQSVTPDFSGIVKDSPVNVKLTRPFKAGYNSLCLPFATTKTALGATKAYEFGAYDNGAVTMSEVTDLAAGTPYIVTFESAVSEPISFTDVTIPTSATTPGSVNHSPASFVGNYTAAKSATGLYGVKSNGDIQIGGASATINGYRAYFTGVSVASARINYIDDDGTTTVKMINANQQLDVRCYNLLGQEIQRPGKGLFIKNGKKFIVK